MAEFVQCRIEEMLPELEQMARVELFTPKETRTILKKRKAYEYKLQRKTKHKDDYLEYIQYEINVLALLKKRRQKIQYNFKKSEIEGAISRRIYRLFQEACQRFQHDVKLWISYLEFAKSTGGKEKTSKIFTQMLQVHNRKPELWIAAAKWQIEEINTIEQARVLLQRGLRFNKNSKLMWTEYFRMELLNVEKILKRREILGLAKMDVDSEDTPEAVFKCKVAECVFEEAVKEIPGEEDLVLSMLKVVQIFTFARELEEHIFNHLQNHHSDSENTWNAVARRHLVKNKEDDQSKSDKQLEKEGERRCIAAFEEAVQHVSTEKMWTYYLEFLFERLETYAHKKRITKMIERLLDVFSRAKNVGCLSEKMYKKWVEMLVKTGQPAAVEAVCEEATEQLPKSAAMWCLRLEFLIKLGTNNSTVLAVVEEALAVVPEKDSLPVWRLALDWCQLCNPDHTSTLLEVGVSKCAEISVPLKEYYLEWSALHGDQKEVKKLYRRLSSCQPLSTNFFRKRIEIENAQPKLKMKVLRGVYEDALREYGNESPDLWLEYIRLELNHERGRPENAGELHWRAMKQLEPGLTEDFITQYTLLQAGKS